MRRRDAIDFCRRFTTVEHIESLAVAIHAARCNVWKRQPPEFFEEANVVHSLRRYAARHAPPRRRRAKT